MNVNREFAICLLTAFGSLGLSGCESKEGPKNIMEGVEQSKIEEYEAMIEAGNAAMTAEDDSSTP